MGAYGGRDQTDPSNCVDDPMDHCLTIVFLLFIFVYIFILRPNMITTEMTKQSIADCGGCHG